MDWKNPFGTDASVATAAPEPVAPVVVRAELTGDGLRLVCPTAEIAAAIEAGRGQLEALLVELAEAPAVAPLDSDGWPVDSVEPGEPCPRCGALEPWMDLAGGRHCGRCEARKVARSQWLADRAAGLRRIG